MHYRSNITPCIVKKIYLNFRRRNAKKLQVFEGLNKWICFSYIFSYFLNVVKANAGNETEQYRARDYGLLQLNADFILLMPNTLDCGQFCEM